MVKQIFEKIGKYLCTCAEYAFAGIVIGSMVAKDLPFDRTFLITIGAASSVVLFGMGIGFYITAQKMK